MKLINNKVLKHVFKLKACILAHEKNNFKKIKFRIHRYIYYVDKTGTK